MPYCTQSDIEKQISVDELIQITDDRDTLTADTLNGAITADAASIILTDAADFPSSGRIKIGTEEITYTGKSSNTLTGCTRGVNGTVAQAHDEAADVAEVNTVNSEVIAQAIADADAEIDAYCGSQFNGLPFSSVPDIIRAKAVDIAIYHLYSRRQGAPEWRAKRYDDAVKFLAKVSEGKITFGGDQGSISDTGGPEASTDSDDAVFTMGRVSTGVIGTLDNY
jgi:phage gp36-like protein